MKLTYAQKREIFEKGYVKVPGVVPRSMIDAALRAINSSLGQGIHPDNLTTFRAQSFCPELASEPVIMDLLYQTPAWSLLESMIGEGMIRKITGGQLALRFPSMQDPPGEARPHIDGMYSPTNGVPEGTIQNFTAIIGVFLSDVPDAYYGNFTVWPGSHYLFERYFQERGAQSLMEGLPKVELGKPEQITGRAGDVVIAHYLLGHGVSPNVSPHVRYTIFFRAKHIHHDDQKWDSMTDAWLQWPGIRELFAGTT